MIGKFAPESLYQSVKVQAEKQIPGEAAPQREFNMGGLLYKSVRRAKKPNRR